MPPTPPTGPALREVVTRCRDALLRGAFDEVADLLAEDVVVEWPFAPSPAGRVVHGREAFLALARAGREALPVRFEAYHDVVLHETTDPEVAVVEYGMAGVHLVTGQRAAARFAQVFRVRDGRVALLREYQDVPAITAALAGASGHTG